MWEEMSWTVDRIEKYIFINGLLCIDAGRTACLKRAGFGLLVGGGGFPHWSGLEKNNKKEISFLFFGSLW
jgi:hypothetical protein